MSIKEKIYLLSISIGRFNLEYQKNVKMFQSVADNFKNDFSLLCEQKYIDALGIFVPAQKNIRTLLIEIVNDEDSDSFIIDEQKKERIITCISSMDEYDFNTLLVDYINACNTFINLFKVSKINTFEKRKQLALPVLNKWEEFMKAVNSFVNIINDINKVFNENM